MDSIKGTRKNASKLMIVYPQEAFKENPKN